MSTQPPEPTSERGASPRGEVEPPLAEGRYRLVQVLGIGGMASVFRAFDERLQVFRAVKILSPNLAAHESLRARFQTEARTMARLHHPNIVGVHDIGADGDRVFIVMEMVEGGSAWDYLKRHGPLPAKLAVEICLAVLNALGLAHAKGVVHRDIKPHNVLLARDGTPKVADFGIAHVAGGENQGLTKTGSVMGTWGFMAPEQRGGAKGVDARADVYAVGASLYALLTDQMPVDLFVAELDDDLLQAIPGVLKPIIQRSTRYRPDDRYGSTAEMAADLTEVHGRLPEVPEDQPPLGHLEAPEQDDGAGMTMVPPPGVDLGTRSAPTFADSVFDDDGELKPSGRHEPVKPADPERVDAPPGLTEVPDDLDEAWEPPRSPLPKVLGAAAVLLLVGGGLWAMGGGETEPGPEQVEAVAPLPEPVAPPAAAAVEEPETIAEETIDAPPPAQPPAEEATRTPKTGTSSAGSGSSGKKSTGKAGPRPRASEPKAEPKKQTATAKPKPVEEPPSKGVIFVTGDHTGVWLVGSGGRTFKPGEELSPGSYQVKASFDGGKPVVAGKARVSAGQRVTLHCDAMFWKCQQQ